VRPVLVDGAVVAAARAGDQRAVEEVLRAHQPSVHAVCRRLLGDDGDAADATQEALMAIVRGLPRFDGRSALSTWIYRVATNAALDELRRRRRRPMAVDLDDDRADDPGAGGRVGLGRRPRAGGADGPALDDQVGDRLDLDAALGALTVEFRAPVVLRDVLGLDYAEIAEVLDLPPGTVRSRISRGRAALARSLRQATGNQHAAPDVTTSLDAP
jgi:RNA polymerase sigma-70 factor (ECF subfamily)